MKSLRFVLVLVAVVGAVATITYLNRSRGGGGELVQSVKRERNPVRTIRVEPIDIEETAAHTGDLSAARDITVTAEVTGKIRKKYKQMGDRCRRGEALFLLDAESYRIARSDAEARLRSSQLQQAQAKRDLQRTAELAKRRVVAGEALDRAETALKTAAAMVQRAQAALQHARRNLRESRVSCAFDGTVAETMVDVGQVVTPQVPLARLVDTSVLKLVVKVSSGELSRLRVGQRVELIDPAVAERTFAGEISRLGVAADPATHTFPVEVRVPGDGGLRPGQVVRSTIIIGEHRGVLVVPEAAVASDEAGQSTLTLVVAGKAQVRKVTLGARLRGKVIIATGLQRGEEVIVAGHDGLKSGDAVEVIRTGAAAATPKTNPSPKKR